ncbi:hypothetical protein [uncultured Litoreibacter sp.]|uniref:hypothetical protein n=1 Tax=uncultured Litoreibacter sp. TaxID=1392394 RepID=UPI00263074E0|nr:hypothetical protein [uncultured Litoreibacter sp.]
MKVLISVGVLCLAQGAAAQDVGLQFDEMPVGTQWTIEYLDDQARREETYLGREGDFHITEYVGIKPTGERRVIFKRSYDAEGRLVKGERDGAANTTLPFSCRYAVGECTHESKIPNVYSPSNDGFLESTRRHVNRLEGGVFYFGMVLSDGTVREFPFELGKYNIRVAQEYENNLGQKRGFKLISIVEP